MMEIMIAWVFGFIFGWFWNGLMRLVVKRMEAKKQEVTKE